jgi:hypothetical protein
MTRVCTVCTSPARSRVDAELAGGPSLAATGRRFKLSPDALLLHRRDHLSPALAKVAIERYTADSAGRAFDSVVDRVESLVTRLEALLSLGEQKGALTGASNVAREVRQSLELIARLRGELDTRPTVTTVNLFSTPEFANLVSAVLEATQAFPEARLVIADRLDAIQAGEPG